MNEKEIVERVLKMCTNTSLVFPIDARDTKDMQWKVYNNNKNKEEDMKKKCTCKKVVKVVESKPNYKRMYEDAQELVHVQEQGRLNLLSQLDKLKDTQVQIKQLQDEKLKLENKIMELNKELDRISRARLTEQHDLLTQHKYESERAFAIISKLKNIIDTIVETL